MDSISEDVFLNEIAWLLQVIPGKKRSSKSSAKYRSASQFLKKQNTIKRTSESSFGITIEEPSAKQQSLDRSAGNSEEYVKFLEKEAELQARHSRGYYRGAKRQSSAESAKSQFYMKLYSDTESSAGGSVSRAYNIGKSSAEWWKKLNLMPGIQMVTSNVVLRELIRRAFSDGFKPFGRDPKKVQISLKLRAPVQSLLKELTKESGITEVAFLEQLFAYCSTNYPELTDLDGDFEIMENCKEVLGIKK